MEKIALISTIANPLLEEFAFLPLALAVSPRAGGSCGRATSARSARSAPRNLMFVSAFVPGASAILNIVNAESFWDFLGRRRRRRWDASLTSDAIAVLLQPLSL